MFSKILIANRGEIAVRIIRACKEMGISTVAVYSEADKEALHVSMADESICIGASAPSESYLNMSAIISAANVTGAQAIHPGYGLLSENVKFADLCKQCGIVFIGPDAEIIKAMGDKENARKTMDNAGVPIIKGSDVLKNKEEAVQMAEKIGYPVMLKARSGGGGKGIRLALSKEDVIANFDIASREAENAFGDEGIYMEKYIESSAHIEVQILADKSHNIVCLGERECSIQLNNQKLIEETPSVSIGSKTRGRLFQAAIAAAKACNYENAGTVEFLLDKSGDFYFMEMNTRLQVEHTITEMVTGIDIVKWQIRIAAGVDLDFAQDDIEFSGSAMECRINSLMAGKIDTLHIPGGLNVRFDTAIYQECRISPFYDSMIGKLIVKGAKREETIRKMNVALCELIIEGIATNIDQQLEILSNKKFIEGNYDTTFMEKLIND